MRRPIIAGNWKMYKTKAEAKEFIDSFRPLVESASARVFLAVPYTAIPFCVEAAQGSSIHIGAQNMHDQEQGAFTGEVSAKMLKDVGATFVLLGHSERRQFFGETNDFIHRKMKRALHDNVVPILCIGETEKERELGKTEEVLIAQLSECLASFSAEEIKKIVIAYEPVWAIGTGKTATPAMAEEAHLQCRNFLSKKWGSQAAETVPLLYGGSVKADTISALMQQPNIDGALVGGASLDAKSFAQIVNFK